MRLIKFKLLFLLAAACLLPPAAARANGGASLQFTVAAPDPVMAGEEVIFQTLVVNTGSDMWTPGTYYWVAEVYSMEGEEKKFVGQTDPVSPAESVPAGGAHGVQITYLVPEMFSGRRLLYRAFLVLNGRRVMETDYRGFQVIEREFRPPPAEDVRIGGDVSFTYKNSSPNGWDQHQGITSANIVGKVKQSSFLFNTYLVHTHHKPVTANLIFLNYYAPWGTLSLGDVSPTLTPLSMESQGMRGVAFERTREKSSITALIGRIVAAEEPTVNTAGRMARYTGGFRYAYQARPNLKLVADAVLSRDDEYSITQDTRTFLLLPKQNMVYGGLVEWKAHPRLTWTVDAQMSSFKEDIDASTAASGMAWKQELKWRGNWATVRAAYSSVGTDFESFASPGVIKDRNTTDLELGLTPADWTSLSLAYNSYTDNLESDPAKTTTKQTQTTISNTTRVLGSTMLTLSANMNSSIGEPASVQDNQTDTLSFSVMQPLGAHNVNVSFQSSDFADNTGASSNLSTSLISLSGSFKVSPRMSASAGMVTSDTAYEPTVFVPLSYASSNNTINANLAYTMPRRAMAVQVWGAMTSGESESPVQDPATGNYSLTSNETGSTSLNMEVIWLKSRSSKFTFGAGMVSRTDTANPALEGSEINIITRYNYSF